MATVYSIHTFDSTQSRSIERFNSLLTLKHAMTLESSLLVQFQCHCHNKFWINTQSPSWCSTRLHGNQGTTPKGWRLIVSPMQSIEPRGVLAPSRDLNIYIYKRWLYHIMYFMIFYCTPEKKNCWDPHFSGWWRHCMIFYFIMLAYCAPIFYSFPCRGSRNSDSIIWLYSLKCDIH